MSKNTNLSFLTDYITADITNGRIGINNASPTVAFDVVGATKITGVLTLTSTISNGTYAYTLPSATGTLALTSALSGTTNYVAKFTSSSAIGNSLIYDDGTKVGIGTTSTVGILSLPINTTNSQISTGSIEIQSYTINNSWVGDNVFYNGTNFIRRSTGYASQIYFQTNGGIAFFQSPSAASGTTPVFVTSLILANTGAATFSSSVTIEGNGSTIRSGNELRFNRTDNAIYTRMYDAGSGAANGFIFDNTNGEGFHFKNTTTTLMRMNSAGNVGIGTSSAGCNLDIFGAVTSTYFNLRITDSASMAANVGGGIALSGKYTSAGDTTDWGFIKGMKENGTSGDYGGYINFYTRPNGGSFTERMRITSGGTVLVGTTSSYNLGVTLLNSGQIGTTTSGGINIQFWNQATSGDNGFASFYTEGGGGALRGSIDYNRGAGLVRYNVTSDYRLKEDLKDFNGSDILNQVKVYDYKLKETGNRVYGVMAHELQEVIPYAVGGVKDGEKMQSVDYSIVVPVLVKAIQELSAEITIISNKIK